MADHSGDEGRRRRAEGMAAVWAAAGEWGPHAAAWICLHIEPGWTGIAEGWRGPIVESEVGPPHHKNAWGALSNHVTTTYGLVKKTGRYKPMKEMLSNAHSSPEYVRTDVMWFSDEQFAKWAKKRTRKKRKPRQLRAG